MVVLKYSLGFLVQIVPCALLCAIPFANCFRSNRKRVYAALALTIALLDVVFTLAGTLSFSSAPFDVGVTLQNALFFVALALLLGIFVYSVNAKIHQKVFVFLIVACFGYVVTQLGDVIAELSGIRLPDYGTMYDTVGLSSAALCTAVLFAPMTYLMKSVRKLVDAPIERSVWFFMNAMLAVELAVLMTFELVPKFFAPHGEQNFFLIVALVLFAALSLVMVMAIVRKAAVSSYREYEMASAARQHIHETQAMTDELAQAHARIVELEQASKQAAHENENKPWKSDSSNRLEEPPSGPGKESITLKMGSRTINLLASDITYVESLNRIRIVHLAQGETLRTNIPLARIVDALPPEYFAYCHRSVAVNIDYIRRISGDAIILQDETEIPISRRRMQEIREIFEKRSSR